MDGIVYPKPPQDNINELHGDQYVIRFGKYKGKTLKHVWVMDPRYIHWIIANTDLQNVKSEIYKTSFYLQ